VSHLFERPLCGMGAAYDYAFRPVVGDAEPGLGGPCDDRPHRVELFSATTDPRSPSAEWQPFVLCPDHEAQLRRCDERLRATGRESRFRRVPPGGQGVRRPT
jgi:hypothetical protein